MQVPSSDPAQVTEGVIPVMLHFNDYFMSLGIWEKFQAHRPGISFDDFWSYKIQKYEEHNSESKSFFFQFSSDPVK